MGNKKRIISPFLTIYKPQVTSMFSIMERVTGIVLVVLAIVVVLLYKLKEIMLTNYWFYNLIYTVFKSGGFVGVIVNMVVVYSIFNFFYHLLFGMRYLYWDKTGGGVVGKKESFGVKMEIEEVYKSSYILLAISVILTILSWVWLMVL